jgi:hypothetical protein
MTPHLKNNQSKMEGTVAQPVEYLLCKGETLTSTPVQPKNKNKKKNSFLLLSE